MYNHTDAYIIDFITPILTEKKNPTAQPWLSSKTPQPFAKRADVDECNELVRIGKLLRVLRSRSSYRLEKAILKEDPLARAMLENEMFCREYGDVFSDYVAEQAARKLGRMYMQEFKDENGNPYKSELAALKTLVELMEAENAAYHHFEF